VKPTNLYPETSPKTQQTQKVMEEDAILDEDVQKE